MPKKTVLVTGTGGRSVGAGILHALLRCGEEISNRWNIIAADANVFSWGLYKTKSRVLLPHASQVEYLKVVLKTVRDYGIEAIVPGSQSEIEILSEKRNELGGAVLIANRHELIPLMMDKFRIEKTLNDLGLPFIETKPIDQWESIAEKYGFPLIVKPTVNTGASRGVCIIADEREIKQLLNDIEMTNLPCVQPYLGTAEDEYTVGVLTSRQGKIIDSIVMRRELTGLSLQNSRKIKGVLCAISSGYSQGYIIKHPEVQSFCEDLAVKLGSCGPLNIQLRMHHQTPYVFEIHPRFSGTTPIRAEVGFNEVDLLLRNFLNDEQFGRINYTHNVAAIRAFEHVIVPINQM